MSYLSPFDPILPALGQTVQWAALHGSSLSLALHHAAVKHSAPLIVITPDNSTAQQLYYELRFFNSENPQIPLLQFPDWETLPYDVFSPHHDIISQRLLTLSRLPNLKHGILIIAINTLLQRLAPTRYLQPNSLVLKTGEAFHLDNMRLLFEKAGYRCVPQVMEHGEFAVRGALFDLFPMGSPLPYRIELLDAEIDTIRTFDPETQRTCEKIDHISLLPAREFPFTDESIRLFRQQWRTQFSGNPLHCPIYQDISQRICPAGIEYYLPLFFTETATLLDYLPKDSLLVCLNDLPAAAEHYWQEIHERYQQRAHDVSRPILAPGHLFLPVPDLFAQLKQFARINQHDNLENSPHAIVYDSALPPQLLVESKAAEPLHALQTYMAQTDQRILFCAESTGRREILLELLNRIHCQPIACHDWQEFLASEQPIAITVAALDRGLSLQHPALAIIVESQLFGQQVLQRRRRKTRITDATAMVRDLTELNIGSPVVHVEHGVGRYLGLQTLQVGDHVAEFLTLEYARSTKLYVPVASLHLISRYSGTDLEHAPLHSLGNDHWEKVKRKAAEKIRDVAAELLNIHAQRAAREGIIFNKPDEQYYAFTAEFPFEETPDQQQAIHDVINDMTINKRMDRLICGDVGFGKTEVAIRAAFLAVQSGKQVALLVPTTLLAQQHWQNFQDRFAGWPIHIDMISRFRSAKEQQKIFDDLQNQKIDIIIGTHKLLSATIKFNNLGLLIIDEEHRFGVRHKEKLKALRAEVDILTLTATPIPRTLNLALSGTRDLSIIATPPARRLSIKTFVQQRNDATIREAILREIMRGGQVYFLHNKIETIEKTTEEIRHLVPEARVNFGHGQMHEHQLEQIMRDFYHQRFNVLVSTTIIESGIDIPTANTIIIDRADHFGLAQLHQLRGRVGRSHHQAYAYLMTPSKKLMTSDAQKRLEAIAALEDLGAGFTLATHDLEIRGAGEILGEEQSGHLQEIGFSLYMELLEQAMQALKNGEIFNLDQPLSPGTEIDLQISALIPENYLPDVFTRLTLYKRIAGAETADHLRELQVEMIDRFGLLPPPLKNLFLISELKVIAKKIGIKKIEAGPNGGRIDFIEKPNIDPKIIIQLMQKYPNKYKLDAKQRLRFSEEIPNAEQRIATVEKLLQQMLN